MIEAMIATPPSASVDGDLARVLAREGQHPEQHHGDRRDGVGLEQVGCHAGAVADVVADVVRDHRGVPRVVLGDAGLDLAHQVGADVGRLGEDATAESRTEISEPPKPSRSSSTASLSEKSSITSTP